MWNKLPKYIVESDSLTLFKRRLVNYNSIYYTFTLLSNYKCLLYVVYFLSLDAF